MVISEISCKYCIIGGTENSRNKKISKIKEEHLKNITTEIIRFDIYDLNKIKNWDDSFLTNNCLIILVPNIDAIPKHHIGSFKEIYQV